MRGSLIALVLVLLAGPATAECAPTFRAAESRVERRVSPAAHVGFSVILIGCEADLQSLTNEEMAVIQRHLEALADEARTALEPAMATAQYRNEEVRKLKSKLGRGAISDLFFFSFQLTEYHPRP